MNPTVHHDELQGQETIHEEYVDIDVFPKETLGLAENNTENGITPTPAAPQTFSSGFDTETAVAHQVSSNTTTDQSHQNDRSEALEMINVYVPQPEEPQLKPCITVVGVGGAGGNAVNNMIADSLQGVDFVVANTDAQALNFARTDRRIQLGTNTTQGLGAGAKPDIGRAAAEESVETIAEQIQGANMVFITAGMGGGTGTGAAPVIARTAREMGILTVGVVTKPFQFEGAHRMRLAESGIEELSQYVDTLIIIPNQNLFRVANEKTTFGDAFRMADNVLNAGVRSITDLMIMPGLINLDFADVRTVMSDMGRAMMGTGEASGERRAIEAAEAAIANPLLEDTCMKGAKGVLINITGGPDITLFEVDEAANRIRDEVEGEAHIIFGSCFDPDMEGKMRVSVVATGIAGAAALASVPTHSANTHAVSTHNVQQIPAGDQTSAAYAVPQRPAPQPAVQQRVAPNVRQAPQQRVSPQGAPVQRGQAPMPQQTVQHQPAPQQSVVHQPMPQPAPQPAPQQMQQPIQQTVAQPSAHISQPAPQQHYAGISAEVNGSAAYDMQPVQRPAPRPAPQPQPAPAMIQPQQMDLPEPRKVAEPFIPPHPTGRSDAGPLHTIPAPPPVFSNQQPRAEERVPLRENTQPQQPMARQDLRDDGRQDARAEGKPGGFFKGLAARLTREHHEASGYGDDDRYEHPTAVQEPTLSATPADRPATSQADEDELAIPAFLRRQAN